MSWPELIDEQPMLTLGRMSFDAVGERVKENLGNDLTQDSWQELAEKGLSKSRRRWNSCTYGQHLVWPASLGSVLGRHQLGGRQAFSLQPACHPIQCLPPFLPTLLNFLLYFFLHFVLKLSHCSSWVGGKPSAFSCQPACPLFTSLINTHHTQFSLASSHFFHFSSS